MVLRCQEFVRQIWTSPIFMGHSFGPLKDPESGRLENLDGSSFMHQIICLYIGFMGVWMVRNSIRNIEVGGSILLDHLTAFSPC